MLKVCWHSNDKANRESIEGKKYDFLWQFSPKEKPNKILCYEM
jgi:hypothetical protein